MPDKSFQLNREIPFSLKVNCFLGGLRYQFSLLFLSLFVVFFLVFAFDFSSIIFSFSENKIEKITGTLINTTETIFNEGVHRPVPILGEDIYKYSVSGKSYKASSLGANRFIKKKLEENSIVVEYIVNNPSISRIKGMSPGLHLSGGITPIVIIAIIILIIFSIVCSMSYKRFRLYRLLKNGLRTTGTVISKKLLSNTSESQWYEVVYEFMVDNQRYHLKNRPYCTEQIEIGEQQNLLYDRDRPHKAALLDSVPCSIVFDESDQIITDNNLSTVTILLIPITSISLIIISIYFELFG